MAYEVTKYWTTKAQRARNFTATLENFRTSLEEAQVDYAVCLPIAPYLTFDDLAEAKEQEERILPFTSIDLTRSYDVEAQLNQDVARGALGLKLHPIIQNTSLMTNEPSMLCKPSVFIKNRYWYMWGNLSTT